MKAALLAALIALLAKPAAKPAPKAPKAPPLAPLSLTPSVARVKVTIQGNSLVVVEDVTLPRGAWKEESIDFHVPYGAPSAPRAIDARLVPLQWAELEAADDARGESLALDPVPRRPATAHALLGRENMAGVVVHLPKESLAKAFEPAKMAVLRVRIAYELPALDPQGARSVVVRLGALPLGRIVIGSKVTKAEAKICGTDDLLAVTRVTKGIAPILAQRHPSDDLCLRLW
jgi:hypothetical protein